MKILFIAPLPPPVSGNSLAVLVFKEELDKCHQVEIVNFNKKRRTGKLNFLRRMFEIGRILLQVVAKKKKADVIYFSISESVAGNLKDLLIYMICFSKLDKTIIHLHGGAGLTEILSNKTSLIYKLNHFFISRLGAIVVLGKTHVPIFKVIVPEKRIHIIPNFAQDFLFRSQEEISLKFQQNNLLRILFLSNLIYGKGYNELIEAYLSLEQVDREKIHIDIAGEFGDKNSGIEFLKKIEGYPNISYRGFVGGEQKKELLQHAHIFCLPTYYPYEGQPISILEAYASGCVVITTNHSGIGDVFVNGINGFEVEKKSPESIKQILNKVIEQSNLLPSIGQYNRDLANKKYRTHIYNNSLKQLVTGFAGGLN